jgi:chromate transporter
MLIPSIGVLTIALLYGSISDNPIAQSALQGMNAVVAGMVLATGLKLMPALKKNPLGYPLSTVLVLLTIVCVNVVKMPLAYVLLGIGGVSTLWAARQLERLKSTRSAPNTASEQQQEVPTNASASAKAQD